jgi:hypothetical protein
MTTLRKAGDVVRDVYNLDRGPMTVRIVTADRLAIVERLREMAAEDQFTHISEDAKTFGVRHEIIRGNRKWSETLLEAADRLEKEIKAAK